MNKKRDNTNTEAAANNEIPKTAEEKKQQQSDPQLTELKGLIDPKEELEVKGTDNPF